MMVKRQQRSHRAFTLIEIMVALGILGLLIALTVPNYRHHLEERDLEGAYKEVSALLKFASATARAQGGNITVNFSSPDTNIAIDMLDTQSAPTRLVRHYEGPNDTLLKAGAVQQIVYNGSGGVSSTTFPASPALLGNLRVEFTSRDTSIPTLKDADIDETTGGLTQQQ